MERQNIEGLSFLTGNWPLDDNKSTLLLIHGAGGSGAAWIPQIEGLMNKVNVIAIDLPGHGKSENAGIDNIPDYAKIVAGFIEDLGINKCIPAGISMGGGIVQQLLLDYSNLINAGILINTGAKLKVLPAIFESIKTNFKDFVTDISGIMFPPDLDIERLRPVMDDFLALEQDVILGDYLSCDIFDIRERLHEIDLPVLIISSDKDTMTPLWYGEYLEKNIEKTERVIIEGAGHLAPIEKPDKVTQAILEYLKKLARFNAV